MKKNNVIVIIVFLLAVTGLFYSFSTSKKNNTNATVSGLPDTSFKLGTMSPGYTSYFSGSTGDPYNWYYVADTLKKFGFNSSVFYSDYNRYDDSTPAGQLPDGGLYQDISKYKDYVSNFIDFINNKNILGNYERGTIKKLCGSQRSTYEAEDSTTYGFYNNISPVTGDTYTNDKYGVSGRCAKVNQSDNGIFDNPGYLISGLIENAEQSDTWKAIGVGGEDDSTWYIKPRMRIDSIDAITYQNTPIARVDIVGFWGNVIKSVEIFGNSFFNNNGLYNGKYLEEFLFGGDTSLTIKGDTDTNHLNHGARTDFDSTFNFKTSCRVDYRIYWYGVCNLWVDYVRVEDQWAHELFKDNAGYNYFAYKIGDEAKEISRNGIKYFAVDCDKNNLPSIAYIRYITKTATDGNLEIVPVPKKLMDNLYAFTEK